jgi:uncharacterized protein YdaU (DUF1376 family)
MSKSDDVGIWLPVYIGEMLAMTTRFSTEQIGALHLLMMDYWKNGVIPHDNTIIAAITGLSKAKAKVFITLILSIDIFHSHEGSLYSPYLDDKKQQATSNKKTKSERAKKAADARWHKNAQDNKQTISTPQAFDSLCSSNAYEMPEQCPSPSSSSKPSLSHSAKKDNLLPIKDWVAPSRDDINKRLKKSAPHVPELSCNAYEAHVTAFKNYYGEQELLGRPILTDERRYDVLVAWVGNDNQYRKKNKNVKGSAYESAPKPYANHQADNAFEQAAHYIEQTQQSVDAFFNETA